MTAPHPMTQAEFARLQGWSRSHVTGLKQAGRLVMVGGLVDVEGSVARINETRDPNRADVAARHEAARNAPGADNGSARASSPQPDAENPSNGPSVGDTGDRVAMGYQQARAVNERYKALTAKTEYELRIGKLVETDAIARAGANLGTWLRATVENLIPQLSAEMSAARDAEQGHAILVERFEQLLSDYSARIGAELKPESLTP